jgi:hypothetical protein
MERVTCDYKQIIHGFDADIVLLDTKSSTDTLIDCFCPKTSRYQLNIIVGLLIQLVSTGGEPRICAFVTHNFFTTKDCVTKKKSTDFNFEL